jgi:hypothetical protein
VDETTREEQLVEDDESLLRENHALKNAMRDMGYSGEQIDVMGDGGAATQPDAPPDAPPEAESSNPRSGSPTG